MTSPSANWESATIVNAVVEAYMASNAEWSTGMTRNQITALEKYLRRPQEPVGRPRPEVEIKLVQRERRATGRSLSSSPPPAAGQAGRGPARPRHRRVTIAVEQFRPDSSQELFTSSKIELTQAEALLVELKRVTDKWRPRRHLRSPADEIRGGSRAHGLRRGSRPIPRSSKLTAKMNSRSKRSSTTVSRKIQRTPTRPRRSSSSSAEKMDALKPSGQRPLGTRRGSQDREMGLRAACPSPNKDRAIAETTVKIRDLGIKQSCSSKSSTSSTSRPRTTEFNEVQIALVKESHRNRA